MECHVSSCDVMVAMPPPMLRRPVSAYRASLGASFRPTPFVPPPPGRPARRDPVSRISPVRPCAGGRACRAGAVHAPDRARETADAPSPSAPAGAFGPSRPLQRTEKAARKPPLPAPIIPHFPTGQAPCGPILKLLQGSARNGRRACALPGPGHPEARQDLHRRRHRIQGRKQRRLLPFDFLRQRIEQAPAGGATILNCVRV